MAEIRSVCHQNEPSLVMAKNKTLAVFCSKCREKIVAFPLEEGVIEAMISSIGRNPTEFLEGFKIPNPVIVSVHEAEDCLMIECADCQRELFIVPLAPGTVAQHMKPKG